MVFGVVLGVASLAFGERVTVEDRVPVVVNGRTLADTALLIDDSAYLRAMLLQDMFGAKVSYVRDSLIIQTANVGAADDLTKQVQALQTELDSLRATNASLEQAAKTLEDQNTRLTQDNDRLLSLVQTAQYFSFRAKRVGRSIEMPTGAPRQAIEYWGIVTCDGEDLFVFLPDRGGPKDASGIEEARATAERLNQIVSTERELKPEWFVTTAVASGRGLAIAYDAKLSGNYETICAVQPAFADVVFQWLDSQKDNIPVDKRLRTREEAEELVRDWWLALLRDHVSLIRNVDFASGTTTSIKDSGEMFINIMRSRLAMNPIAPGDVRYPPLQILDLVQRFSPEQKLTYYDIHHEEGLLAYLREIWRPVR